MSKPPVRSATRIASVPVVAAPERVICTAGSGGWDGVVHRCQPEAKDLGEITGLLCGAGTQAFGHTDADLPHVHSYTRGLDLDIQAATAALTMPHHNGRTACVNTKTKMIKRQMYGRAGFALLRHRILLG